MPTKKRRKRLTWIGTHVGAMCLIAPNAPWALDFQVKVTADGRILKMLNVIDEFSREALAIEVERPIDADHVAAALNRIAILRRGAPAFLRFNNGPEFIAHAVADKCRFNSRFREEQLNLWHSDRLLEARVASET